MKTETEIRRAVALLHKQFDALIEDGAPDHECTAYLMLLGFAEWIIGEQSEAADGFGDMIATIRDAMATDAGRN